MKIKYKEPAVNTLSKPGTVPVTNEMHEQLAELKKRGVKINEMTRDFWTSLIDRANKELAKGKSA